MRNHRSGRQSASRKRLRPFGVIHVGMMLRNGTRAASLLLVRVMMFQRKKSLFFLQHFDIDPLHVREHFAIDL